MYYFSMVAIYTKFIVFNDNRIYLKISETSAKTAMGEIKNFSKLVKVIIL